MARESVHFSNGNYETRSSKLAELNLKIARTSVKVRNTKLLSLVLLRAQKRISEQGLN